MVMGGRGARLSEVFRGGTQMYPCRGLEVVKLILPPLERAR